VSFHQLFSNKQAKNQLPKRVFSIHVSMNSLSLPQLLGAARAFQGSGRIGAAEKVLRAAIDRFPQEGRPYLALATLVAATKSAAAGGNRYEESLDVLLAAERSVSRDEKAILAEICGCMAGLCIKMGRPEEALTKSEEVLSIVNPAIVLEHRRSYAVHGQGLRYSSEDSVCQFNFNVAIRQLNRLQDALRLMRSDLRSVGADLDQYSIGLSDGAPSAAVKEAYIEGEYGTMNSITVVVVKWGNKYGPEYVNRLAAGLLRNAPRDVSFQMICFTDDSAGVSHVVQCR
jgi:hypothetical protein